MVFTNTRAKVVVVRAYVGMHAEEEEECAVGEGERSESIRWRSRAGQVDDDEYGERSEREGGEEGGGGRRGPEMPLLRASLTQPRETRMTKKERAGFLLLLFSFPRRANTRMLLT